MRISRSGSWTTVSRGRHRFVKGTLLVSLLLLLGVAAAVGGAAERRLAYSNDSRIICISHWTPMVICDGLDTASYYGYQVTVPSPKPAPACSPAPASACSLETKLSKPHGIPQVNLFRRVAEHLGWNASSYQFRCMDWDAMIDDLRSPNGSCYLSAAGVEVTTNYLDEGFRFTWPTYTAGAPLGMCGDWCCVHLPSHRTAGAWGVQQRAVLACSVFVIAQ
jgi:hypothetical protein